MGVHGLWKLLESTGKPINPETLEGKILAVDISIWLNQAVKGVRDRDGNNVQNAHLLTLFHRLCKLLFFRIKPVFVYDGDAPLLKKQTLAIRRQRREEMTRESKQTNEKLLRTFLKRQAIKAALGDHSQEAIPSLSSVRCDDGDDMYVLPTLPPDEEKEQSSSEEETERDESVQNYSTYQEAIYENPNSVDINSEEFSIMPPEIKHEILKEMKELNKRRRTLYHKPPERSGDFSQYQLAGLLQRNKLNQRLEGVEKEMNHRSSGGAEQQLGESKDHDVEVRRLVSENSSHYILIKGSQKAAKTPDSRPSPALWSSCPWERKGRPTGKPEPLWRPITEDDENKPSSSSSSSASKQMCVQEEEAPPSPRTLHAIQSAMMDTSSDEDDEAVPLRAAHSGGRTTGAEDKDGSVSPQTLHAIQNTLKDDSTATDLHRNRKRIITISSDEDEGEQTVVINDNEQLTGDSGVSPRTLLAVQEALGSKTVMRSSEREDSEEVLGIRSAAAAPDGSDLIPGVSLQAGSLKSESKHQSSTPLILHGSKPKSPEDTCVSGGDVLLSSSSDRKHVKTDDKDDHMEEKNCEIVVKSEDDVDSSSEESFIEVSDAEKPSETEEEPVNKITSDDENKKEKEEDMKESSDQSSDVDNSAINESKTEPPPAVSEWEHIDVEELVQLERDLQDEQISLREQQQQQERHSSTVTGQMCQESQELLRLFGVPFIVAPMEAEAQCAALDRSDHTHGTITDDSDIWLFGGRHVYKNFFNQNKYVEHFQSVDLQNQLGLDRTKMINLAYLLGSDYTEGIPGVGYVTGMEILNEFPGAGLEPLMQFSEWWTEAQENKKLAVNPKDTKVKKKLRNVQLHPGFPNPVVAQAYLQPTVDQSDASFSWSHPHLELIKEFCQSRFGWNSRKTDETLRPVLKQLNTQQTQLRIDSFFHLEQQERQAIRSQRLRRAVTCLKRKEREEDDDEDDEETSPAKQGKSAASNLCRGGEEAPGAAGPLAGGFLGSAVHVNTPTDLPEGGVSHDRMLMSSGAESSSSSSEDDVERGRGVVMVTARSVFGDNKRKTNRARRRRKRERKEQKRMTTNIL
ncbi:LOW QUALITY PROTEIN: DNA excision repair protein ERCC-5 [Xyrauchen texanus]|uniref:LOW QUALITY PROTEIN: DNA excision repair protein ERCC-5 n=1 Tax=Xyrauchen texanus TaxID=154827 RepID=UPI002242137B|nr:LOW QUALITY PROTEIN: DNA excision repair protein ERCC-5 [Xyrauchen texanus]